MLRNVEIKAKIRNLGDIVSKAKRLSNSEGTWIKQDDVFFSVPQGRLKLRTFEVSLQNN
jgi:adenylate cyclase class IV